MFLYTQHQGQAARDKGQGDFVPIITPYPLPLTPQMTGGHHG